MALSFRSKFLFVQALTLVRVPLIVLVLAICVTFDHPIPAKWFAAAFAAMLLSVITDFLDGYFARGLKVMSQLGSHADPLTDKVFYLTAFPTLIYLAARVGQHTHSRVLVVLAVLFLLRDQWVSFLRSIGALHGISGKANWSGKARTIISFPVICVVFYFLEAPARWPLHPPVELVYALEGASVAINLVSIAVYTVRYWPALAKEMQGAGTSHTPG
jgi:CDP-diacylglycerol--glycerol-3-phosphate 3-phosphatidyltransferase